MMNDEDLRLVWVGNLSDKVNEKLLYELFLQAGPVEEINLPKNFDGRPRPFCFIKFKHQCSVQYAANVLRDTSLFGRQLNIRPKIRNAVQRKESFDDGLNALRGLGNLFKEKDGMRPNYAKCSPDSLASAQTLLPLPGKSCTPPLLSQTVKPDYDSLLKLDPKIHFQRNRSLLKPDSKIHFQSVMPCLEPTLPSLSGTVTPDFDLLINMGQQMQCSVGYQHPAGRVVYPSQREDPVMASSSRNRRPEAHSSRNYHNHDKQHPYRDSRHDNYRRQSSYPNDRHTSSYHHRERRDNRR